MFIGKRVVNFLLVLIELSLGVTAEALVAKIDAQLSQRDRAAGCFSFGQKWETGTGRHYFTDIIGLSSTTVT